MDLMELKSILNDILAVLVIYKTKPEESKTFSSLTTNLKGSGLIVDILIYDNSPSPKFEQNKQDLDNWNIHYIHDPTNPGVSKAYNFGCEVAKQTGKNWLLLLDQDSNFPPDTFLKYCTAITEYPQAVLFASFLVSESDICSPCAYYFKRGFPLKEKFLKFGDYNLKNRSIINSGLLIKTNVFEAIGGYNEDIKLDFSDFNFIDRYRSYYQSFILVNIKCIHELSSSDNDFKSSLNRFNYYCEGARKSINNIFEVPILFAISLLRALKLSIRFRSIKFIEVWYKLFWESLIHFWQ